MIRWIRKLFRPRCEHDRNYTARKYNLPDGTPMVKSHCLDCGWFDEGPVIMNESDGWPEPQIVIRNGVRQ